MVTIKKRTELPVLKKVMVMGAPKSGKSTFVEQYCKDNGLNGVVIDIDDTNYTDMPLIRPNEGLKDCKLVRDSFDDLIFDAVMDAINTARKEGFDTIVIDGWTLYMSDMEGEAVGWDKINKKNSKLLMTLKKLRLSGLHIIIIGQSDMKLAIDDKTNEIKSNKAVLYINSFVNEVYECSCSNGIYKVNTIAKRTLTDENSKNDDLDNLDI
jgi:GTPase SAR1 family protein